MARRRKAQAWTATGIDWDALLPDCEWHEAFVWMAAFIPLVWVPSLLDLYDLPKRAFLNLIILVLLVTHSALSAVETGALVLPATPLTLPVLAWLGVLALSCAKAYNLSDAADGWLQQGLPALMSLVLLARGLSVRTAERFITCAIGAGLVATGVGLAQYYGYNTDGYGIRQVIAPASIFGNKNMAAEYILIVLALVLYRAERQKFSGWYLVPLTAIVAFLSAAKTKAVWVGMAVLLSVTAARVLLAWRRGAMRSDSSSSGWTAAKLLAATVAAVLIFKGPDLMKEVGASQTGISVAVQSSQQSASVRFALWANSIPMLAKDPLLGVGPMNWYIHYPKYAFAKRFDPTFSTTAQAEHPHNDLVQIVCESGLLGLAAFAWILLTLAKAIRTSIALPGPEESEEQRRSFYLGLAMLAILVDGVFAYPLHLAPGASYFWVMAALVTALAPGVEPKPKLVPGSIFTVLVILLVSIGFGTREVRIMLANAWYHDAAVAMAGNKWADAEKALKASIRYDATRYRTHSVLGRAIFSQSRIPEAVEEYRRALECHPNQINVLYNLGHALQSGGNVAEAIEVLNRSIEIVPRFQEGLYLLGTLQKLKGDRNAALKTFLKLAEVAPKYADGLNELGNLYKDMKQYSDAEKYYRLALEAKPDYGEVYNNLGVIGLETHKFDEASHYFRKAIELSPSYPGSYFNLGKSEESLGKKAEAIAAFQEFVKRWTGDEGTKKTAQLEIDRLSATKQPLSPGSPAATGASPPGRGRGG